MPGYGESELVMLHIRPGDSVRTWALLEFAESGLGSMSESTEPERSPFVSDIVSARADTGIQTAKSQASVGTSYLGSLTVHDMTLRFSPWASG